MGHRKHQPFENAHVRRVFDAYPVTLRTDLLGLRDLILRTAHQTKGVGEVVETLKWGQPAYLPSKPRIGSTIRIDALKSAEPRYAMFFHCQTTLVATFLELYENRFAFLGERAIVFDHGAKVPREALGHCVALALTYH